MTAIGSALRHIARDRLVQGTLVGLVLTLIATTVIVPWHRRLARASGLLAVYRVADAPAPAFEVVDAFAEDEHLRLVHVLSDAHDFIADRRVLGFQIE